MLRERDSLICDMAEYYHILDIEGLPVRLLATLAFGLPEGSRSKLIISGERLDTHTALLAIIADRLNFIAWSKTEDAQKNINRPQSILEILTGTGKENDTAGFASGEDFEAARRKILMEGG